MVVKGNPKRFIIGVWVLTALLIFWFNAAALTSLLDKPLPGMSPEARTTIAKWQRLENSIALKLEQVMDPREIEKIVARIDFKKLKAIIPAKKSQPMPTPAKKTEPAPKKPVRLPALSGIVAVYGTDGAVVHLAVIDGKTREENSRIGEFLLEKIDATGILLAQDDKNWFVPAPTVDFSMDTSMEE
jgi:hypothetical protein